MKSFTLFALLAASLCLDSVVASPFSGIARGHDEVSPDATCGGRRGYTCLNSRWGNCCSKDGRCGSSDAHCGTGCQCDFGACKGDVSKNGKCGSNGSGTTCLNSRYGDCCSRDGSCGSSKDYCGTGCQAGFGKCNPVSSARPTSTSSCRSSSVKTSSTKTSSTKASSTKTSSTKTSSTKTSSTKATSTKTSSIKTSSKKSSSTKISSTKTSSTKTSSIKTSSIKTSSSVTTSAPVTSSSVASSSLVESSSSVASSSSVDSSSSVVSSTTSSSSAEASSTISSFSEISSSTEVPSSSSSIASSTSSTPSPSPSATQCPGFPMTGVIQVYNLNTQLLLGVVSKNYDGQNSYTQTASTTDALQVQISYSGPDCTNPTNIAILTLNSPAGSENYPYFGAVGGSAGYNFQTGALGYAYYAGTGFLAPNSPPSFDINHSIKSLGYNAPAETSIWTYQISSGFITPTWTNTDGTSFAATSFYDAGVDFLGAVGDYAQFVTTFPNEGAYQVALKFVPQ